MNGYLTSAQVEQLLKPINGKRVSTDGKGFSHVEAYDVRAHLNRIFGFGRWSNQVTSVDLVFETEAERAKDGKKWTAWTVCYRAVVKVTVCAPDGTFLASYEDGATGDAANQPSRADAHDLALKTALSQALKRAAVNLGDQFGLSLYNKGSLSALVGRTLVVIENTEDDQDGAVDEHIDTPLAPEADPEPPADPRERTTTEPDGTTDVLAAADSIRDTLEAVLAVPAEPAERLKAIGGLMKDAQRLGCLGVKVTDPQDGRQVALKVLLEQALRGSRAA